MKMIEIQNSMLTVGSRPQDGEGTELCLGLSKEGGGVRIPGLAESTERYLSFYLTVKEEHSMAFEFNLYTAEDDKNRRFCLRFGVFGNIRTFICIDLNWLDASVLFPEPLEGALKFVCHGARIERKEIAKAELVALPCYHDISVEISDLCLSEEYPRREPLSALKLVDCFGQNRRKEWRSKIHSEQELKKHLSEQCGDGTVSYPFDDWSQFGGWKEKKLTDGSGFFSKKKEAGKWWLVDPEGYAFFSVGPDCVGANVDCRIDGVEQWLDWLPEENDPVYGVCFGRRRTRKDGRRQYRSFDYAKANLIRAFGTEWYETWKQMIASQLSGHGLNTIANWSDRSLFGTSGIPYVTSLPEFPSTQVNIFRDFPDVLSEEYKENAVRCAQALRERKDDPYMIGYFLRNEPSWAFVNNLILADEVLYNPQKTCCKEVLVAELQEKYGTIEALNTAWESEFEGFSDLYRPQKNISSRSEAAMEDMRVFSRKMVRAYIEIPSKACREVDRNHMILGMRWAWISDPDLVTGWENFDVFSINCYATDPTAAIQNIADHHVDLPVMIGEFHFGALDAGLTATGLEGVMSQKDRGMAYRYYCERAAAHPYGVGCHYFQCYDQFALGRFDGENYNIGLFDICFQPYPEMMAQVKACSSRIYQIADGKIEPTREKAVSIPMIAY